MRLRVHPAEERWDQVLGEVVGEAVRDLGAIVSGIYLFDQNSDELVASVVAGAPPAVFTMPGRIRRDSELLSAAVLRSGRAIWSGDFAVGREHRLRLIPYPRSFAAVPLIGGGETTGVFMALGRPRFPTDCRTWSTACRPLPQGFHLLR